MKTKRATERRMTEREIVAAVHRALMRRVRKRSVAAKWVEAGRLSLDLPRRALL